MTSYLVTVVVTDPDGDTARALAEAITQLCADAAELGRPEETDTITHVADPIEVVP